MTAAVIAFTEASVIPEAIAETMPAPATKLLQVALQIAPLAMNPNALPGQIPAAAAPAKPTKGNKPGPARPALPAQPLNA